MEDQKRTIGPVTQAAGIGGALALIICYVVAHYTGIAVPAEVQAALSVVIGYIGALIGGWLVRPGTGTRVDRG